MTSQTKTTARYTVHRVNRVYRVGWSDFSFLWNFEKKQVGVVTFGKKNMFSLKFLINSKTETRRPLKGSHKKKFHRVPL